MDIFEIVFRRRSKVGCVWTLRQVFDTQLREAEAERSREETGSGRNRSSTDTELGPPTTPGSFCRMMGACRTVRGAGNWEDWQNQGGPEEPGAGAAAGV